ncbi:antitoxin VbhA family protein [Deinococcus sp.]|uniref:antitoxin VbhA family protein n=1 Tax=Deinococcus sp. TaxID=47478 RepID=UPI003B591839
MTTMDEQLRAQHEAAMAETEAREQRRKIVRSVAHSSAMEGMPLGQEMQAMLAAYAEGTLTTQEIQARLDAKYRR